MAKKIFCLCASQTNWPRSEGSLLLYFVRADEASEANWLAQRQKNIFFGRHLCIRSMHWLSKGMETIFAMENSREQKISTSIL